MRLEVDHRLDDVVLQRLGLVPLRAPATLQLTRGDDISTDAQSYLSTTIEKLSAEPE